MTVDDHGWTRTVGQKTCPAQQALNAQGRHRNEALDLTLSGEPEHLTYTNTGATGQTYYLILDNFGTGAFGAYTLVGTMSCPPVAVEATSWGSLKALYNK